MKNERRNTIHDFIFVDNTEHGDNDMIVSAKIPMNNATFLQKQGDPIFAITQNLVGLIKWSQHLVAPYQLQHILLAYIDDGILNWRCNFSETRTLIFIKTNLLICVGI